MTTLYNTFEQLDKLRSSDLLKKTSTNLLIEAKNLLQADLTNTDCKFSKSEFKFSKTVKYIISSQAGGLIKYFPFLVSSSKKKNIQLISEMDILFGIKNQKIESIYANDILVVDEFLDYTDFAIRSGCFFC